MYLYYNRKGTKNPSNTKHFVRKLTKSRCPQIKYISLDIHQNIDISIIIIVCNTFNKHTLHQITPSITQKEAVSKVTDTVS